jgi:hypothetical protein
MRRLLLLLPFFPTLVSAQGINSALVYVGGSVPQWGSNPDLGAQINAAYSSCPATGCTIVVTPKFDGMCYDYNTPIILATPGKYVLLQGGGPTSEAPGTQTVAGPAGGACLNYIPTTATAGVTLDYSPIYGGGNAPAHGIRDLILENNSCQKIGGCGSAATGVQFGGTNSGAQNGGLFNVRINGFGTGLSYFETGSQSWGMVLTGISVVNNKLGISFTGSLENISMFGGRIAANGVGISMTGNADVFAHGVSIDSNITAGVIASSGLFSCSGCHWENESLDVPITTHYYIGSNAASLVIEGGKAIDDDTNPADTTDFWFKNSGLSTYIHGLMIYSPGRKATQIVQSNYPCSWWVSIFNDSPSILTTLTGGSSFQGVLFPNDFVGVSSVQAQFLIPSQGTGFSTNNVGLSAGWGTTAFVADPAGTTQRFSFVVASSGGGQSLNPSLYIYFPTVWPQTPFYMCKTVGGTGVPSPLIGEATASRSQMILIFNGTPVSGQTYQIQCIGQ